MYVSSAARIHSLTAAAFRTRLFKKETLDRTLPCRPGALTGRARIRAIRAIRGSNHPSPFLTGARREHRGSAVSRENENDYEKENEAIRFPPPAQP